MIFYKPPKDNYNIENIRTITAELERVLYKLNGNNSEVLITGDYNIHWNQTGIWWFLWLYVIKQLLSQNYIAYEAK